jgi:hypothetical protein
MSVTRHHSIFERMVTIIQKIFSSHRNILYGPRFVVLFKSITRKNLHKPTMKKKEEKRPPLPPQGRESATLTF